MPGTRVVTAAALENCQYGVTDVRRAALLPAMRISRGTVRGDLVIGVVNRLADQPYQMSVMQGVEDIAAVFAHIDQFTQAQFRQVLAYHCPGCSGRGGRLLNVRLLLCRFGGSCGRLPWPGQESSD